LARLKNRFKRSTDIWPGFVDAISTLLLVLIFLLVLFLASEFFLSKMLSKKDDVLEGLNLQIFQLSELLSLEKKENKDLTNTISSLNEKLNSANFSSDLMTYKIKILNYRIF